MRITCTPLSSMQVGVRQQREEARALDRLGQLPLVARRGPGDARRDDLAGLVDEVLQHLDVLVVDPLDLLGGEAAELAAPDQRPLSLVLLVLAELPLAFAFALQSASWRHVMLLPQIRCRSRAAPVSWSAWSLRSESLLPSPRNLFLFLKANALAPRRPPRRSPPSPCAWCRPRPARTRGRS